MKERFVFAADERGTMYWPSSSKTRCFGGFIYSKKIEFQIENFWGEIKSELCGTNQVELKWSHFFEGRHQQRQINPLLEKDPTRWRELANWALSTFFKKWGDKITPIAAISRKDKAAREQRDFVFEELEDGRLKLHEYMFYSGAIALFILYVWKTQGRGEIWMDHLGSLNEEERVNQQWLNIRANEYQRTHKPEWYRAELRIKEKIKFLDSKESNIIQLADFLTGTLWAAGEDDNYFLEEYWDYYSYDSVLKQATLLRLD